MYCEKCGNKNNINDNYCTNCGEKLNSNIIEADTKGFSNIKVISVLAIIFSVIFAPVGIILSSIGLYKCNKYKKKYKKNSSYISLNIIGLVISIVVTFVIILIIFVLVLVLFIFKDSDDVLQSTWNCKISPISSINVATVKFYEDDFIWGKYGDVENNNFKGKYHITSRNYENGKNKYIINFKPNYFIISGKESSNYPNTTKMEIEFDEESAIITSSNSTTYYCKREFR